MFSANDVTGISIQNTLHKEYQAFHQQAHTVVAVINKITESSPEEHGNMPPNL
jgi:hypothetical protein